MLVIVLAIMVRFSLLSRVSNLLSRPPTQCGGANAPSETASFRYRGSEGYWGVCYYRSPHSSLNSYKAFIKIHWLLNPVLYLPSNQQFLPGYFPSGRLCHYKDSGLLPRIPSTPYMVSVHIIVGTNVYTSSLEDKLRDVYCSLS